MMKYIFYVCICFLFGATAQAEKLPNNPWLNAPELKSDTPRYDTYDVEYNTNTPAQNSENPLNSADIHNFLYETQDALVDAENRVANSQFLQKLHNYSQTSTEDALKEHLKKRAVQRTSGTTKISLPKLKAKDIPGYQDAEQQYRIYKNKAVHKYNRFKSEARSLEHEIEQSIRNTTGVNMEKTVDDAVRMLK